jgi:hypothetical protein
MVNLKKKLLELYKSYVTSYITIISHAKGGDHANGILGIYQDSPIMKNQTNENGGGGGGIYSTFYFLCFFFLFLF